jgi:hypothetical protein
MMIRRDAEELASTAQGIGAQVIQGLVRHPGREGGPDIWDVNIIEEPLWELKDQEVPLIVAPLRPRREPSTVCWLCRTPYQGAECPACSAGRKEAKRVVEERLLFDEEFPALLGEG